MAIHPWKEALDIWSLCWGEGVSSKTFGVERSWIPTSLPERNADRVSAFDLVLKDCYSRDYQNRYVACWLSIHYKISCRHWNEKYVHFNYWSNSIEDGSACPAELEEEGLSIWVAIFTPWWYFAFREQCWRLVLVWQPCIKPYVSISEGSNQPATATQLMMRRMMMMMRRRKSWVLLWHWMMMLGCQWIIIFMAGLDSNCLDHLLRMFSILFSC